MTRNSRILLVTHLLALGVAYGVAKTPVASSSAAEEGAAPGRSKSSARERQMTAGDGGQLLASFLNEQSGKPSKYEKLKASLPVADDLKGAVMAAVAGLGGRGWANGLTADEQAERLAEVEVRVLHWMKQNPGDAMDFLLTDPASNEARLPYLLQKHVFKEIASENGLLKSLSWLTKGQQTLPTLCVVALDEMKAGGGVAFLAKLQSAMEGNPLESVYRDARVDDGESADPFRQGEEFLLLAGAAIPFSDKEKLLEFAKRQDDEGAGAAFLLGFAKSDARAAAWLLDLVGRGELGGDLPALLKGGLGDAVLHASSMDLEKRVAARRATEGNENKPRQDIVNELVGTDVRFLLENGRDWRYEFRNGTASVDDVLGAVRGGLSGVPAEGEDAMIVALYRHLAEENPAKARPLLDSLPEEKRRDALFSNTWQAYVGIDPDVFLRSVEALPEPVTPQEKDFRTKGWNWKARGYLARYGDDYVEWVKQMPPGIDKDTAMNSLVWATREQNPAKARELAEQLYPKKP